MTITPDKASRSRMRELLSRALDLVPDQREAFLRAELSPGEALDEALELIRSVDDLGDFLERPAQAAPSSARFPLPKKVGSFRIERILGWGSMGVVYLAQQAAPRRPAAVKVLRLDAASDPTAARFQREGELLALLSHPGIAAIYDMGATDLGAGPQPYLAMEYVDGVPITTWADEQGLDRRARVELVRRVAAAVEHAHANGVLHRDLKPENVLVDAHGIPRVLDFGVALATREGSEWLTLTATGQVVGTVAYMAPEQARGRRVDERADQFALGAILHELLTGELPFDIRGRLPHEALRMVAEANWCTPTKHDSTLAGDLGAILATVLAPEPGRRYPDVTAFADDLGRWLDGTPVVARPPSTLETMWRSVRRHHTFALLSAAALLALGASLFWGFESLLDLRREESVALLFSDRQRLRQLEEEAATLWPTSSASVSAFEDWLERADDLIGRQRELRDALDIVAGHGEPVSADGATLQAGWVLEEGHDLIDAVGELERGLAVEMTVRARNAMELHAETIGGRAVQWEEARARVGADPRFDGFALKPVEGLVPLGPDQGSGLEEFAVWLSGEVPGRDETGRIVPEAGQAIVLVLIPGGDVWVGAQRRDPEGVHFDARAHLFPHPGGNEGPPIELRLDPFLISKFELTQDQWVRLAGFNPSDWEVGSEVGGQEVLPTNPVESLSWQQALEILVRVGLTLPTEAQWETAALAGAALPYMVGRSHGDLRGYANWNTHSTSTRESSGMPDDGFVAHMPVGRLRPNAYGLHDVLGNVWELCLDVYKVHYHSLQHRQGDGLVLAEPDGDVSRRGWGDGAQPEAMRVWGRQTKRFDGRDASTGVRPAMRLVPIEGAEGSG